MKNKKLFEKTVSILVKAYQEDTLEHQNCYACAVGNLVAANMGYDIIRCNRIGKNIKWSKGEVHWNNVFMTILGYQNRRFGNLKGHAKKQIDSTGYDVIELSKIEFAFETASKVGDYMFNGLMAVVDTLMLIHQASQEETQSAKLQFVKS